MKSNYDRYSELLNLTNSFLTQEHNSKDRLFVSPQDYNYYLEYAKQKQQPQKTPAIIDKSMNNKTVTNQLRSKVELNTIDKSMDNTTATNQAHSKIDNVVATSHTHSKTPATENLTKRVSQDNKTFVPDTLAAPQPIDVNDLRMIITERLPGLQLLNTIPDDSEAKRLTTIWKQEKIQPQVVILSFDEIPMHHAFLANLAHAINVYGYYTKVIRAIPLEEDNQWDTLLQTDLKLVIGTHSKINTLPNLLKNYREAPKQAKHFLKQVPLIHLADIAFYLKEPKLKLPLWKSIQEMLFLPNT